MTGLIEHRIEIPDGVNVEIEGDEVKVSGPNGAMTRVLKHPRIRIDLAEGEVIVSSELPRTREKALAGTFSSHIKNMIHGALRNYEYRLKIVYSHFPMKVNVRGDRFVIENFMGERAPRHADIRPGVKVSVKGSEVVVAGPDIEAAGQTAANIERATAIRGYDPRVFQDGIYIVEKARRSEG